MKILIAGGTGFIGGALVRRLEELRHTCFIVSRQPNRSGMLSYRDTLPPVDAVINLAGESVVGLWTQRKRAAILSSRVKTTEYLVEQMRGMNPRPRVFVSASAVGIYG